MVKKKQRALVLVPGFGGGCYSFNDFVKNDEERKEFKKIFGNNIISPDIGDSLEEGAKERAEKLIEAITLLKDDAKITICTYSGGGFVVRCLMSMLRSYHPKIYDRVELVTIEDGAIRGAYVPPSYLLAQVLGTREDMCCINVPLLGLDKRLQGKLGREITTCWPVDVEGNRENDSWIGVAAMRNHRDRDELLYELAALDNDRHWGEGAYTVAYTNGGTEPFDFKSTADNLVHYKGRIVCTKLISIEIAFNIFRLEIDTSKLACVQGSNIKKLEVEFTEKTGAWAQAPGCTQTGQTGSKKAEEILNKMVRAARDHHIETLVSEYSREEVAYIHTTSSLDIGDEPFHAIFGKDDPKYLAQASNFDEISYKDENQEHWDKWYRADNLNRVKEGPPK